MFRLYAAVERPEGGPSADRGMLQRVIEEGRGGVWHAGGRPSKQPISRDAGLVGVHLTFGVQIKGFDLQRERVLGRLYL